MSERMNNEKAREELRDRKILAEIEYNQSEDAKKKDSLLRYIQALDIAIESLQPKAIKYDDLSLFDKLYEFMCDHALAIAPDERHSGEERLIKQTQYDLLQDLIDLMQRMKAEDKADKE